MPPLYLLDPPQPGAAWAPFAGTRPIAELRAGAWRIRERWERALGRSATAILAPALTDFHELDEPPVESGAALSGPALVVRSDVVPPAGPLTLPPGTRRLTAGGAAVGWVLADGERWSGGSTDGAAHEIDAFLLGGAYDLITALERLLGADCEALAAATGGAAPDGCLVLGPASRVVAAGASVEPGVVFDVRSGAVVLSAGVEVRSGTRLEGPCFIGAGCRVLGGFIRASAFGPRCTVRGEISTSVFVGYANKSHDGFVGHSALGHWVNLGAGTTTSNLKNTYGMVRLDVGGASIETGRSFLGSLIADHAKTAIGTMLSTGTVVGAGANVFGAAPPKYVPPFAWGSTGGERLTEEGFLRTAERVLPRRDVTVTPKLRAALAGLYRRGCAR